jgi:hypothetical protein
MLAARLKAYNEALMIFLENKSRRYIEKIS